MGRSCETEFSKAPVRRLIISEEISTVHAINERLGYRRTYPQEPLEHVR